MKRTAPTSQRGILPPKRHRHRLPWACAGCTLSRSSHRPPSIRPATRWRRRAGPRGPKPVRACPFLHSILRAASNPTYVRQPSFSAVAHCPGAAPPRARSSRRAPVAAKSIPGSTSGPLGADPEPFASSGPGRTLRGSARTTARACRVEESPEHGAVCPLLITYFGSRQRPGPQPSNPFIRKSEKSS